MKRGRKSRAELVALGKRPADLREPWQIEQGARCGCNGTDDLCPCQNENPWPRPFVDWKARAETAEANLSSEAKAHEVTKGKLAGLERALREIRDWPRTHEEFAVWGPIKTAEDALAALDQPIPSETAHDQ